MFQEKDVSFPSYLDLIAFCWNFQFKIAARQLASDCERELYKHLPDLQEVIDLVLSYNEPEVVMEKGLFTVFRQMQMEDEVEQMGAEGE